MPSANELLQEEVSLNVVTHTLIVADQGHRPHATHQPSVEVFLLATVSEIETNFAEGQDTANLIVVVAELSQ